MADIDDMFLLKRWDSTNITNIL